MRKADDTGKLEDITQGFGLFMAHYDWQEAMRYASFNFSDVKEVVLALEGENDERDWKLVVLLNSGQFGWLSAWCDYTGWDCQAGGDSGVVDSINKAIESLGSLKEYDINDSFLKKLSERYEEKYISKQRVREAIQKVCSCMRMKEGEQPCGHCPDELVARDLIEELKL